MIFKNNLIAKEVIPWCPASKVPHLFPLSKM